MQTPSEGVAETHQFVANLEGKIYYKFDLRGCQLSETLLVQSSLRHLRIYSAELSARRWSFSTSVMHSTL